MPPPNFRKLSPTRLIVIWNVTSVPGGPIIEHILYQDGMPLGSFQTPLYEAKGLTPFRLYTFQVETCTQGGCGRSLNATIRMPEAPPKGMEKPSINQVKAGSFNIVWNAPSQPFGIITAYIVEVCFLFFHTFNLIVNAIDKSRDVLVIQTMRLIFFNTVSTGRCAFLFYFYYYNI